MMNLFYVIQLGGGSTNRPVGIIPVLGSPLPVDIKVHQKGWSKPLIAGSKQAGPKHRLKNVQLRNGKHCIVNKIEHSPPPGRYEKAIELIMTEEKLQDCVLCR